MPLFIIRNDITRVKADAIVNTANPKPTYGAGTDLAVYQAAGAKRLLNYRRKIGDIPVGQAAVTPGLGLPAKHIIHTVGPVWQGGGNGESQAVRSCYEQSLNLALKLRCKSVAFPLISTGSYGFPKEEALRIALDAIRDFLEREEMAVYLVVFDKESLALSEKLNLGIEKFIDDHYAAKQTLREYQPDLREESQRMPERFPTGENRAPMEAPSPQAAARPQAAPSSQVASSPQAAPSPQAASYSQPLPKPQAPFSSPQAAAPTPQAASYSQPLSKPKAAPKPQAFSKPRATARDRRSASGILSKRSLDEVIGQVGETFQERLLRLVDERGYTDVQVYKRANLDRKLFSKIRCNPHYKPKKKTALALAIALELNLDETKDLLGRAELALSPSSVFDLIIEYFILNETYDIYAINVALFQHGQPLLGE